MAVVQVWRYPVKSLQGERLDSVQVTSQGLEGDRRFALFDLETGFGLTARRTPVLLFASARLTPGGVEIRLPDGSVATDDKALSRWLGRPVALRSTEQQEIRRYENPADFEHEDSTSWEPFDGSRGAFHDSADAHVSLVSHATLRTWDPRRFRSNLVLDGDDEEALVGHRVTIGGVALDVRSRIWRCVMTTRPQPGGIVKDLDVLRTVHRERAGRLAVGALVAAEGVLGIGDSLSVG